VQHTCVIHIRRTKVKEENNIERTPPQERIRSSDWTYQLRFRLMLAETQREVNGAFIQQSKTVL
jgi:hypothetical protein